MTTLQLNQLAFGLAHGVLGATTNRMGVWTQGCSLRKCPGCTSTHTWSPTRGRSVRVDSMLKLARAQSTPPTGVTISGGEPTDQAAAVMALIHGFRGMFPDSEVVLYTGLRWPVLRARYPALVALLDVAVTGPFVRTLEATALAGSGNQDVRMLTPLADRLYRDWQNWPRHRLQVGSGKTDEVVTVGIPHTIRMIQAAKEVAAVGATWEGIDGRASEKEKPI